MIQNYISDDNEFLSAWRKVLRKEPVDFVTHFAIATQKVNAIDQVQSRDSPIHVAASVGNVDLYEQIMVKLADMNPKTIFGDVHPLFYAVYYGNLDICKHIVGELGEKKSCKA